MFRGWYDHTLDHKGRVSVPSDLRDVLNEKYSDILVVSNFPECLVCYPKEEWEQLEKKVASLSQVQSDINHFQRYFISAAIEAPIDKQGRILIPPFLRENAKLEKDVVFVGMLKRIEIWSKPKWVEAFEQSKSKFGEITNVLANLGV